MIHLALAATRQRPDATQYSPPGQIRRHRQPEQLRRALSGTGSRRITEERRLVYLVDGDDLVMLQARFHYE